ncbi:MAG: 30S ribosomal protein S10 [Firmicutes bacterium]|nr:30S ribosomal protein S10 [Bacillota bacterium]MCL2770828.1 30S ribosomal protein S10 [Bacillota bacterium]
MSKQKVRISIKSYDANLVDQAMGRIVEAAKKGGGTISGPVPLPTKKEVVTVIRSPHKYKDSREQFELRTHKRILDIFNAGPKLMDVLMKIELPAGVDIKIGLK